MSKSQPQECIHSRRQLSIEIQNGREASRPDQAFPLTAVHFNTHSQLSNFPFPFGIAKLEMMGEGDGGLNCLLNWPNPSAAQNGPVPDPVVRPHIIASHKILFRGAVDPL